MVNSGSRIIRYIAALWARWVLARETHRKTIQRSHRTRVLRVASAFRTTTTIDLGIYAASSTRNEDETIDPRYRNLAWSEAWRVFLGMGFSVATTARKQYTICPDPTSNATSLRRDMRRYGNLGGSPLCC
uniref:Secreted protein n=1 Tax=Anopheles maculatus TaxID=74869 RepID=A0A182SRX8_9DIPT